MTDEDGQGTEVPKTATDLRIEGLESQIAELKQQYASAVQELQNANRGLWAELHPAQAPTPTESVVQPEAKDTAYDSFKNVLGIGD